MDSETDLSVSEDALGGADFITVELDTQPIEYVVKWAEVGSRFTISCVKRDPDDPPEISEDAFFAPYEEVYPCEVTEQSVEIKTDSDEEEEEEEEEQEEQAGVSQLQEEEEDEEEEEEEEERQYRCSFCGKSYSHASSLYRHQQTHSKGGAAPIKREPPHQEAQYSCPHCGMTFKGSRMLGSHLRLHGKRRIHPCNICGKEFNHSSSLSRHRLVHKKGKGLPKEDMAALRHPQKAGGRRQKSRRAVAQSPPGDTFYACPQCDMSFRTSTQLSKHQVTHVKELLDSYTPGKENLGESSSDLKIRLKLCSRDKPNFYTLCKKNRRRRGGGGRGVRRGPAPSEEEGAGRHVCSQCGKRFSHASSLARHQLTHRGGGGKHLKLPPPGRTKTFTCTACSKTFMHSSSFSRHKKAHLEEQQRHKKAHLEEQQRHKKAHLEEQRHKKAHLEEQRHKKAHLEEQRHKKAHLEEQRHKKAHLEEQRRRKRPALDETAPLESDSE